MSVTLTLRPGLTLTVEDTAEATRDGRPRFAWTVTRGPSPRGESATWSGDDLHGPAAGPEPTERDMLATFCVFLAAALEARRSLARCGFSSGNERLFPASLLLTLERAHVDPDELSLAADELQNVPGAR